MELNQKPIIFLKIPEILQKQKNYRPVSLMNIDVKIHNKLLAYLIQQYIKRSKDYKQVGFISHIQTHLKTN